MANKQKGDQMDLLYYLCCHRPSPSRWQVNNDTMLSFDHGWQEVTKNISYTFHIGVNNRIKLFSRYFPYFIVFIDGACIIH